MGVFDMQLDIYSVIKKKKEVMEIKEMMDGKAIFTSKSASV